MRRESRENKLSKIHFFVKVFIKCHVVLFILLCYQQREKSIHLDAMMRELWGEKELRKFQF